MTHIAPQAVISTHLSDLEELLLMFDLPGGWIVGGWETGGQIYLDYISLIQGHQSDKRRGTKKDCISRLLRSLPNLQIQSFEQRVAQTEMSRVVANMVVSTSELVKS